MVMEERVKMAFDFASDSTKQLITLSTGIVAITITFGKDVFQKVPFYAKVIVVVAWVIYLFSIGFGILTLLSLTGTLEPVPPAKDAAGTEGDGVGKVQVQNPSIRSTTITRFSVLQIITFVLGTIGIVVFGIVLTFASLPANAGQAGGNPPDNNSSSTEQRVREQQRALIEGLIRKDLSLLDQIFAKDCIFVGSLGQVLNLPHVMDDIKSGVLSFELIDTDDVVVHVYEVTAIETGHAMIKGRYKDLDISGQFRYCAVYAQREGKWQAVSYQVALLVDPRTIEQPGVAKVGSGQPKAGKGPMKRGKSRGVLRNRSMRKI